MMRCRFRSTLLAGALGAVALLAVAPGEAGAVYIGYVPVATPPGQPLMTIPDCSANPPDPACFTYHQMNVSPQAGTRVVSPSDPLYTARLIITPGTELRNGDFFTTYDVQQLIPGTIVAPAGFVALTPGTGPTPSGVNPVDDPLIPNVAYVYTGPTLDATTAPIDLGEIDFQSNVSQTSFVFSSQTHQVGSEALAVNQGTIRVTPVPEPSAAILAALGLPALLASRRAGRRPG